VGALDNSAILRYVQQKAWPFRATEDHLIIETCPICNKDNWHFYIRFAPKEKEGLWDCKVCGETGNLYQLREYLGDRMENAMSIKDVANASRPPAALPDVEAAHRRLMTEAENIETENPALDYLLGRGFTIEVIERYKLGLIEEYGKRWLVIPYFNKNNLVYAKFRTLPPDDKEFRGLSGRECPLFNGDVLEKGMEELLFVEGEADTLACLSAGIEKVVGVPGANMKKAAWINRLDEMAPQQMYLLYDRDKTGQNAARDMAARIGLDKVKNILLPEFTYLDEQGEERQGKDINEWFRAGNTLEDFEKLKAEAKHFDVDGVYSAAEVIDSIKHDLLTRGSLKPKYVTRFGQLNHCIGGFDEGDLIGLMAEAKVGKTTLAMQLLDELSVDYDEPALMFCQEMQPKRMVRKWIANVTDTPDDQITLDTVDNAMQIAVSREADYLFAYTKGTKRQEIFETIRQAVRRYGVKFVCFDNLQLLCRNIEHSAQETSVICKEFKQLAMELNIVIILIIQPHRVREGEIIGARNAHGSSAIEKDVDTMICLHRERQGKLKAEDFQAIGFIEVDENFAPELLVRVDLSRYAPGGVTTLKMIGEKSKVVEMTHEERADKASLLPANEILAQAQLEAA
jgi:hypothetical protein